MWLYIVPAVHVNLTPSEPMLECIVFSFSLKIARKSKARSQDGEGDVHDEMAQVNIGFSEARHVMR